VGEEGYFSPWGGKGNRQPRTLSGTQLEEKSSWARGWPDTGTEKGLGNRRKRSMFLLRHYWYYQER